MKATKYFLILLAVVALFVTACNTGAKMDEQLTQLEKLVTDWQAKLDKGEIKAEDLTDFADAKKVIMDAISPLEEAATEEQKTKLTETKTKVETLEKAMNDFVNPPTPTVEGEDLSPEDTPTTEESTTQQ